MLVMDELTQVYQSGARARALIPRMPVQDGINIIDFGTLYSHSFHPLGGIDGDNDLHGLGMNFWRRTRSDDNQRSCPFTITPLASSMLLGSKPGGLIGPAFSRERDGLHGLPRAPPRAEAVWQRQVERVGVDASAQAGGGCSVGAGAAHGAMAPAHIRHGRRWGRIALKLLLEA